MDYSGPVDDLLVFARSVGLAGLNMFALNTKDFGMLLEPSPESSEMEFDRESLRYLVLESHFNGPPGMLYSPHCKPDLLPAGKMGFDEVNISFLNGKV